MSSDCAVGERITRRAVRWAAIAFVGFCLTAHCWPAAAQDGAANIRLTIDYGDGVQKTFAALPWKEKMTVFDALQAAEKHSNGIKVAFMGRGETIFITAIDDTVNAGANGSNWRYTVNDKPAPYSAGVMELKASDAVVWRFGK